MSDTRICRNCGEEKPIADFPAPVAKLKKAMSRCSACKSAYHKAWADKHKCELAAYLRDYARSPAQRERRKQIKVRDRDKIRVAARDWQLRTKYGISSAQYAEMVRQQGGHCGCCGGDPTKRGLVVDHDHQTGAVRALLCEPCNQGIGFFRESPERLRLAANYIERFSSVSESA